jgi:hypothetical protein
MRAPMVTYRFQWKGCKIGSYYPLAVAVCDERVVTIALEVWAIADGDSRLCWTTQGIGRGGRRIMEGEFAQFVGQVKCSELRKACIVCDSSGGRLICGGVINHKSRGLSEGEDERE